MERQKFTREYILNQMKGIASALPTPISIYLLGGGGLAFYGLKEATKDMDVVLLSPDGLKILVNTLRRLNYTPVRRLSREYRKMGASAVLENRDGFRWDIFHKQVCRALIVSEDIMSRAKKVFEEENLSVYLLSKEDIFLFKGITERDLDLEDMASLAESGIDWNTIIMECLQQSKSSGIIWEAALYERMVDLREKYGIKSPFERRLRAIAEEKMTERRLIKIIKRGSNTVREIFAEIGFSETFVRRELKKLVQEGKLKIDATTRQHHFYLNP